MKYSIDRGYILEAITDYLIKWYTDIVQDENTYAGETEGLMYITDNKEYIISKITEKTNIELDKIEEDLGNIVNLEISGMYRYNNKLNYNVSIDFTDNKDMSVEFNDFIEM